MPSTRAYHQRRTRLITYGRWHPSLVDAAPATAHVHALVAAGYSRRAIATQAGVSENVVRRLAAGVVGRVAAHNAARILAVRMRTAVSGRTWATGARRRLQALAVAGWDLTDLAAATDLNLRTLTRVRDGTRTVLSATTASHVAHVYRRLVHHHRTDPHAAAVQDLAHHHGWAGPSAWTRYTIEDPTAGPLERRTIA